MLNVYAHHLIDVHIAWSRPSFLPLKRCSSLWTGHTHKGRLEGPEPHIFLFHVRMFFYHTCSTIFFIPLTLHYLLYHTCPSQILSSHPHCSTIFFPPHLPFTIFYITPVLPKPFHPIHPYLSITSHPPLPSIYPHPPLPNPSMSPTLT